MPGIRPYSADLNNTHSYANLAIGDALLIKAQDALSVCQVSLAVANGNVFAATQTAGTALLQVGPFANVCTLQLNASGNVRVETSVAGLSVTV